jgi:hypothetical protein
MLSLRGAMLTAKGPRGQGAKGPRGQGAKGPRGQGAKGPRGQGAKGLNRPGFDAASFLEEDVDHVQALPA